MNEKEIREIQIQQERVIRQILSEEIDSSIRKIKSYSLSSIVSEQAFDDMADCLFKRLMTAVKDTFFCIYRRILAGDNELYKINAKFASYDECLETLRTLSEIASKEGVDMVYSDRPLLRDIADNLSHNFITYITEILTVIQNNRKVVGSFLSGDGEIFRITGFEWADSDMHNSGKATAIVKTDRGKFVFRARDCRIDRLYWQLVNEYVSDITIAPKVVCIGDEYGFSEYIENRPVDRLADVPIYYYRLGGLCAFLYALGSTDIHCGNVLCSDQKPVLVDLETVLSPKALTKYGLVIDTEFCLEFDNSITTVGVLPQFINGKESSPLLDVSDENISMPCVDSKKITVLAYEDDFLAGFELIYRRIAGNIPKIIAKIEGLRSVRLRILLESTALYASIIFKSYFASHLISNSEREKVFGHIISLFDDNSYFTTKENRKLINQREIESMRNGDIPYFYVMSDSKGLWDENKCIVEDAFELSPIDHMKFRISKFSEKDLEFEKNIIQNSLEKAAFFRESSDESKEAPKTSSFNPEQVFQCLDIAFERIRDDSVISANNHRGWLSTVELMYLDALRPGFLEGEGGVALFLALYCKSRQKRGKEANDAYLLCKDAMQQTIYEFNEVTQAKKIIRSIWRKPGLTQGLGGIIISLAAVGRTIGIPEYIETAVGCIDIVKMMDIENSEECDLYGGLAGLLVALCSFHELKQNHEWESQVRRVADRLMDLKTLEHKDLMLWKTLCDYPISGAGHGVIGIGLALCLAGLALNEERYLKASEDALLFEDGVYCEKKRCWPDLRSNPYSSKFRMGICSGAPGVGLALLHMKEYFTKSRLCDVWKRNIDRATQSALNAGILKRDHLCCGNSATILFLIELYKETHSPEVFEKLTDILQYMSAKMISDGCDYVPMQFRKVFRSDLLTGEAGAGLVMVLFQEHCL